LVEFEVFVELRKVSIDSRVLREVFQLTVAVFEICVESPCAFIVSGKHCGGNWAVKYGP
jgi:hypothetical protein